MKYFNKTVKQMLRHSVKTEMFILLTDLWRCISQ